MSCNEPILLSTDPDDIAILEGPGVQSVNGKVGKVVLDAGDFAYDDTKEYSTGSVGAALKELSQKEIDVDSALSDTSTNPVQNKVVKAELDKKVTEETGKGLSTNDFTNAYKTKLDNIEEKANKTIVDSALSLTSENPVQNKAVTQEMNDKADVIISTASGSIAHFEDGAEAYAKSVIAHIEPVQEGTGDPSPTNVRPITGHTEANVQRTAKNLLPYPYVQGSRTAGGVTITVNSDGSIKLSGTATASFYQKLSGGFATDRVAVSSLFKMSERYAIRRSISGMYVQCVFYDADGNTLVTLSNTEFSIPTNAIYYGIFLRVLNGTQTDITIYPMLRFASDTDDTYEPYQGETYPITFPSEAGTVYGGYVDAVKGELVVNRAKSTVVSSMTFGTVGSSGHGWYIARSSIAPLNTGENYDTGIVCDKLQTAIGASTLAQDLVFVNTNGQIIINTAQVFNTKEDMLSYFGNSIDIVYPIEPITYQLTPQQITTLLGVNNVWNDCNGNTDVEYKADTKLYIEQLTKPTEDDMTANANIASGKFFMVGNRLFLSTSTIASGDTINPGTNCTELSLADALNNLN